MPRPRFANLSLEKQAHILETAAKAFAADGYEHASMNQILADAGLSKGAAYYYFDNKADLYAATVNHYLGEFLGEQGLDFAAVTAVTFWPTLLHVYQEQFRGFAERPWVFGLVKSGGPVAVEMMTEGPMADLWQTLTTLLDNLIRNADKMRQGFKALGFHVLDAQTAIVPVIIGEDMLTFKFWRELFDAGVFVNAFVSPGVPPGMAMLRTSYMATHEDKHLDRILETFTVIGKKLGVIS